MRSGQALDRQVLAAGGGGGGQAMAPWPASRSSVGILGPLFQDLCGFYDVSLNFDSTRLIMVPFWFYHFLGDLDLWQGLKETVDLG